jgi:hypothetical protein
MRKKIVVRKTMKWMVVVARATARAMSIKWREVIGDYCENICLALD